MVITYPQPCPECLKGGVNAPLTFDTDATPLVYACGNGHTFEDLPEPGPAPALASEPLAPPPPPPEGRPMSAIVQDLEKQEAAAAEPPPVAGKPLTFGAGIPEPGCHVTDAELAEQRAAEAANRPKVPPAVDPVKLKEALQRRASELAGVVPSMTDEQILRRVLESGPVAVGGGDLLIAVVLPERVAVDVTAGAAGRPLREYFNALVTCAFDLGWFQNLNV